MTITLINNAIYFFVSFLSFGRVLFLNEKQIDSYKKSTPYTGVHREKIRDIYLLLLKKNEEEQEEEEELLPVLNYI